MRSHCLTRVNSSLFGALAKATGGNVPAASSVYVLYYLRSWNKERAELDAAYHRGDRPWMLWDHGDSTLGAVAATT